MSIHLIVSESEKQSIVNALAFYNDVHGHEMEDQDCWDQWKICFREDNAGVEPDGPIDMLATKVANCI